MLHFIPAKDKSSANDPGSEVYYFEIGFVAALFANIAFIFIRILNQQLTGKVTGYWINVVGAIGILLLAAVYKTKRRYYKCTLHAGMILCAFCLFMPIRYGMISSSWWLSILPLVATLILGERAGLSWASICILLGAGSVLWGPSILISDSAGETTSEAVASHTVLIALLFGIGLRFRWIAKKQTLELNEAKILIENEGKKSSAFLRNASDGVHILDEGGNLIEVSESFCRLLGYVRAEIIGGKASLWDDKVSAKHMHDRLGENGGQSGVITSEAIYRKKNGDFVDVELTSTPIFLDGQIMLYNAARDISGRKRDELALKNALASAEQANTSKGRFLATMSHELRTPMNGILGMAQIMLMTELEKSDRDKYIRIIISSGEVLLGLLNDILDFSKLESENMTIESVEFCPENIINQTLSLFAGNVIHKGLKTSAIWQGDPRKIYKGDSRRISQMLSNLYSNAVKFTTKGSVQIEARPIKSDDGKVQIEFSVLDTGIGIAEDKIELLFKPFSQVDSSTTREYSGTGLGLSIVKRLAALMEGAVGVQSELGKGSRFWFRVHVEEVGVIQLKHVVQEQNLEDLNLQPLTGHVLVVEDHPVNSLFISAALKRLGMTVVVASDGKQAIDATQREQFDLIFMDVHMPIMDGCAASACLRKIEEDNNLRRTPIVALTAAAHDDDRTKCLAAGMDDFVSKPIGISELRAVVKKWTGSIQHGYSVPL